MRSQFGKTPRRISATSRPRTDEVYDMKGLNMIAPDQVMPDGESPNTINSRRYARNENDTRVAIRTRLGSTYLSSAVGEAADASNAGAIIDDLSFTSTKWVYFSYNAVADGVLTTLSLHLKKDTAAGGIVVVEVYTDSSGVPGELVGSTSITPSLIGTSYADVLSRFMDAPTNTSGAAYWVRLRVQDLGLGTYYLALTAGTGVLTTIDEAVTYTTVANSARFGTSLSTSGRIKGFTRRNPQNVEYRTLFALGTNIYSTSDSPATPVSIDSNVHADAQFVRFAQVDDKTFWVDGENAARWWNGTDTPTTISGVDGTPTHIAIFQNRAMFVPKSDPTRVNYSALYDFESYPSVNFFYVPNPKSPDHVTALVPFQNGLTIFTHETKHNVFGSSVSTFTREEAVGTKGALSQEAVTVDRNKIYFVADDKMVYSYNGSTDKIISSKVEPELQSADPNTFNLHLYRNQLRVYYKNAATGKQRMLLFDIEQEQWFLDTGREVLGSLEWTQGENELIEFSSRAGVFYLGENGNSDVGKAIYFKYWTAYKNYGSGAAKDRIKRFRPVVRPAASKYNLQVGRDINFNNTPDMRDYLVDSGGATWGSFTWGDGTVWGGSELVDNTAAMSGRGKHTQYRFEHEGVDTPVELYGYIALVKSGRPR